MPAEDELNQRIGVLTRRETEARILAPLLEALGAEFGRERVLNVLRETIIKIAQEQGAAMAQQMGSDDMQAFANTLPAWQQDDALRIEDIAPGRQRLPLQRHALPLRRDVSRAGHPGTGRAALLQPRLRAR